MTDSPADILPLAADFPAATREQWLGSACSRARHSAGRRRKPATGPIRRSRGGAKAAPWWHECRAGAGSSASTIRSGRRQCRARHDATTAPAVAGLDRRDRGHGYGLAAGETVIARALDGLPLDAAGVALELEGPQAEEAASSVAALLSRRGVPAATANIRFGFDPLGAAANSGALTPWSETAPRLGRRIAELASAGFKGPFCVADGRAIHNAGGSETQELGFVLAVAVAYLRALEGCIGLADARVMIYFRLAADADQLLSIAKFRALRRLWGRVEDACGLAPAPAFVCAETAWRMMTKHGPYVNMRSPSRCCGGGRRADAITVLLFTRRGLPDCFGAGPPATAARSAGGITSSG